MPRALVVIDVQVGIIEGPPAVSDADRVVAHIGKLLAGARAAGAPVVFVQHQGAPGHRVAAGSRGWAIDPRITPLPAEPVVAKRECDSFYGTELDALLRGRGVKGLVVAGFM